MTGPHETLAAALRSAGLGVAGLEPLRPVGGVWRAYGPTGVWVVRTVEDGGRGELAATLAWAEALSAAGVAVPRPWRAHGAEGAEEPALVRVGSGWALVTAWTLGTAVVEHGWDERSAESLGRLLAAAHTAAEGLPAEAVAGARRYDAAWAGGAWERLGIERVLPAVASHEAALVRSGLAMARRALASAWAGGPGGPVVAVHADVHAENVLEVRRDEEGVQLALIDLDRVGLAPVGLDLSFALLDLADATAWACLRGYRRLRPLDAGFERAYAAFRLLADVDNLGFLAAFDHERDVVASAWPGLVGACAALAEPDRRASSEVASAD